MKIISETTIFSIIVLTLASCNTFTLLQTETPTFANTGLLTSTSTSQPTSTATKTPATPKVATTVAPSPSPILIELPNGLKLEKYLCSETAYSQIYQRHIESSGNAYRSGFTGRLSPNEMLIEDTIGILAKKVDSEKWVMTINIGGKKVYETELADLASIPGFVQNWSYDNHWAIEIIPYPFPNKTALATNFFSGGSVSIADVIVDGISIRRTNKYKEVFGFQLLAGKSFFFFRTDNGVGVSYDGQTSDILFDDVLYRNYWSGFDSDPVQYENSVLFRARNIDVEYCSWIGVSQ